MIPDVSWETLPLILLTIAVAVFGVARFSRAVTYDNFPPTRWWRERWAMLTLDTGWEELFACFWCFSFWAALACIGMWIAGLFFVWVAWAWWILWGGFALGYLAPMVIVRDGSPDEE